MGLIIDSFCGAGGTSTRIDQGRNAREIWTPILETDSSVGEELRKESI